MTDAYSAYEYEQQQKDKLQAWDKIDRLEAKLKKAKQEIKALKKRLAELPKEVQTL